MNGGFDLINPLGFEDGSQELDELVKVLFGKHDDEESCLSSNFDTSLAEDGSQQERPERHLEVTTADTAQVEKRVGPGRPAALHSKRQW